MKPCALSSFFPSNSTSNLYKDGSWAVILAALCHKKDTTNMGNAVTGRIKA